MLSFDISEYLLPDTIARRFEPPSLVSVDRVG